MAARERGCGMEIGEGKRNQSKVGRMGRERLGRKRTLLKGGEDQ